MLALGLCATCYTLKGQDEEHFAGLREGVLERDGHRCRVCDASGREKRSIIVHHLVPGKSVLNLMLEALCSWPFGYCSLQSFRSSGGIAESTVLVLCTLL